MEDDFDIEAVADKVMETLPVSRGDVVWIWASTHSLDLIEALAYRIRVGGAFWTLRLGMASLEHRIAVDLPEPYLSLVPEHELRWLDDVTSIIEVRDQGGYLPGVTAERRRAMGAGWRALIDEANRRGCRRLLVANPTPALAAACGVPLAAFRRAYWQALNVDHQALDARQARVAGWLAGANEVRITSALGTDLRLRIGGRPIHQDRDSLPRGEVYVAPLEDSAEGEVVIDQAFIQGRAIERLKLTFAKGRVVAVSAPDPVGAKILQTVLAAATGDKDVLAEFAIGLNPGLSEPLGPILLDEKIGGSVHIAVGMNEHFGGRNRASLHQDLVILRPSVWLDGVPVMDTGILAVWRG